MLIVLKSALLLGVGLVSLRMLRGGSAAARHLLLSLALCGVILLPLAEIVVPAWPFSVRHERVGAVVQTWYDAPPRAPAGSAGGPERPERGFPSSPPGSGSPESVRLPAGSVEGDAVGMRAFDSTWLPSAPPDVRAWLTALWLLGAALLLLRLVAGFLRLQRMVGASEPLLEAEWLRAAGDAARRVGLQRPVPLRISREDVVPMVTGLSLPVILLPHGARAWSPERRMVVLLHEMAHVRRWDHLAHVVSQLARALYWFNPLVWMASRRLVDERERACDDHVIGTGVNPTDYANHLLQIVREFGSGSTASPALAMARRSQFEGRMLAILDPSVNREATSRRTTRATAAGVLLGMLVLAAARPTLAPASDTALEPGFPRQAFLVRGTATPPRTPTSRIAVPEELSQRIEAAADAQGIPLDLAFLLVETASGFDARKVGAGGGFGLTQITLDRASRLLPGISEQDLLDPATNLRLGFSAFRSLLDGSEEGSIAAFAAFRLESAGAGFNPQEAPAVARLLQRAVATMADDRERARYLTALLEVADSEEDLLAIVVAADRVQNPDERKKVLLPVLDRFDATDQVLRELLVVSWKGLEDDHATATVLLAFLGRFRVPAELAPTFVKAASTIVAPEEQARVLRRAISVAEPSDELYVRILDSLAGSDSDLLKFETVQQLARSGRVSAGVAQHALRLVASLDDPTLRASAYASIRQPR